MDPAAAFTARSGAGAARSLSPQHRANKGFLHAKQRVGSCRLPAVSYSPTERAFHATDVPPAARAAHVDVALHMRARDQKRWRLETSLGRLPVERRSAEIYAYDSTEYEYNFRAEVLPKARPVEVNSLGHMTKVVLASHFHRTAEMPVHPDLPVEGGGTGHRPRWESGTQLLPAEKERALTSLTTRSLSASRAASTRLLAASGGFGNRQAPSLVAREELRMQTLREARSSAHELHGDESLKSIREHQLAHERHNIRNLERLRDTFAPVGADEARARVAPVATQELEYAALMDRARAEHEATLRATRRDRSVTSYRHEGVFEEPQGEARLLSKGRRQWSCCASADPLAKGCVAVRKNPDRWQYG